MKALDARDLAIRVALAADLRAGRVDRPPPYASVPIALPSTTLPRPPRVAKSG